MCPWTLTGVYTLTRRIKALRLLGEHVGRIRREIVDVFVQYPEGLRLRVGLGRRRSRVGLEHRARARVRPAAVRRDEVQDLFLDALDLQFLVAETPNTRRTSHVRLGIVQTGGGGTSISHINKQNTTAKTL